MLGFKRKKSYTKKITFIQPNLIYLKKKRKLRIEPMIYSKLKWLTPEDIECELIDARIEDVNFNIQTDLVVMSVSTLTARSAYKISAEFRKRGIPVVLGGCHVMLCPDEAKQNADVVCFGEAEITWKELIKDFKKGDLKKEYRCNGRFDFKEVKADRSIYKKYHYVPITSIEFSRGCMFNCEFCSYAPIYKQQITYREIDDVVNQIRQNPKRLYVFIDENFGNDIKKTSELLEKMIPLKTKWAAQMSVNALQNPEFVKLMAKSGCDTLFVGFETTNLETLKQMNKMANLKKDSYDIAIQNCVDNDINIAAGLIVGSDTDTYETINETYNFVSKHQVLFCNFVNLLPFPGTPFYERLKKEGRLIFDKWWLEDVAPYHTALFVTEHFSAKEMETLGYNYIKKYYTYKEIFKRFIHSRYRIKSRIKILFGNIFLKYFYIDLTA